MPEQTQTYMAKSATKDLTVISALIIGFLQINGVESYLDFWSARISTPDFPVNIVKFLETAAAVAIFVHRTLFSNNPVAFIGPNQIKPVEVKSLTPTQPPDPPKDGFPPLSKPLPPPPDPPDLRTFNSETEDRVDLLPPLPKPRKRE